VSARPDAGGDACALRAELASGATSARAVVERTLEGIRAIEPGLGALSEILTDRARSTAAELDARREKGEPLGALHGIPLVWKANMCASGVETHCGSRVLAGYRPPYTATFLARALAAGAVPIGVAHMDEFAMGSSGENSAFGVTRNPWDLERSPGGSSSGSAAAVAAGHAPLALGSDTGGSVRQPASFCGLSGFKPTYGRVSRYGLVAFGSSLDQVAPLATSARDLELVLGVIGGCDPRDATSIDATVPGPWASESLAGLRVGVPEEFHPEALEVDVRARVEAAVEVLVELGATRVPLRLPRAPHALATYYVIATAEASSNLARYDGVRYGARTEGDGSLFGMMRATRTAGFGAEVKRRVLLGTHVLSSGYQDEWYGRALGVRDLIAADFRSAFERVDLIAGPTSPTPAFKLGEKSGDPLAMYAADLFTVPASLAGLPAISIPAGCVERAGMPLPVGLQLIGAHGDDARVLGAARLFQVATDHHRARAAIATSGRTRGTGGRA